MIEINFHSKFSWTL